MTGVHADGEVREHHSGTARPIVSVGERALSVLFIRVVGDVVLREIQDAACVGCIAVRPI